MHDAMAHRVDLDATSSGMHDVADRVADVCQVMLDRAVSEALIAILLDALEIRGNDLIFQAGAARIEDKNIHAVPLPAGRALVGPFPMHNFRHIYSMGIGIVAAGDLLVAEPFLGMRARHS